MTLVTQTLSCTGTGTATVTRFPTKVLNASATCVPKLLKTPTRILAVMAVTVPKLLKLPGKSVRATAVSRPLVYLERFGITRFDQLIAIRNWGIGELDIKRWTIREVQRFTYSVRGRR